MSFADLPRPVEHTRLIIVDGKDVVGCLEAIRDQLAVLDVGIRDFGGNDQLRPYLKALVRADGFDRVVSLGIVRDAEDDAAAAFASVRDALRATGLPQPVRPLIRQGGAPHTTILINPSGQTTGTIEDVLLTTAQGNPILQCVDSFVTCLQSLGGGLPSRPSKTRARAFVSAQDQPAVSLGVAIRRGYFPLDHAGLDPLREFVQAVTAL